MSQAIHVVHVDDDCEFADMAAAFLERASDDIGVTTASNVDEALALVEERDVDCVVSDYRMPGTNGLEFLRAVRERHPRLPFFLFTGEGSEEIASEAISEGVTDYLRKGGEAEQYRLLANRIENAVSQRRTERHAATQGRINEVIRDTVQAIIRADTRDGIERAVCERLVDSDPYPFAVIMSPDPESRELNARAWAGAEEGFLDTITVTAGDGPMGQGPGGRAIRTQAVQVAQDIAEDPTFEPWREAAVERGFRSVAAIPLVHDDALYGVLGVFADRAYAFDDTERAVLAELGDTIAHAIHAAGTRTALRDRETQLDRERDLLDRILETVPVGLVVLEPSGVITRCNDQGADILDMACEAVEGATYREAEWTFVDEGGDPVPASEHPFTRVRDEGPVHGVELRMERPHADPIWLSINGASVDGGASTDDRLVFTFEDVTEERRIRDDLRRTNETLEAMVDAAPVAVVTHEVDGTVTGWNPAAEALFGWRESEVLGEPLPPFVTDEEREGFDENRDRLLDGENINGVEVTRTTKAGEERDFYLSAAPIRSLDGEISGIVSILVDITEQKRREQAMETLHDATRGLMAASTPAEIAEITAETAKGVLDYPVNVVRLTNEDGNHLRPVAVTSEARTRLGERPIYGVDEGLPGRAFTRGELVVADERTDPELSLPGDGASRAMYVPIGKFGTLSILDTSDDGFPDTDRHLAEILVANAEAALDRVEREQEVERQNERLDEFASLVSHDLRNPLNVAAGRVELAREERDDEHLGAAADALGRMERLIEDMLSLAREGRTVGSVEPVALRELLESCWRNVDTRDADLVVETDLTLEADASRLRSLVENLFRNAIEHAGSDVTVRVTSLDDGQGFAIEDDGPGIPEADRETVFEPGFSTAAEGTGFGLAIVRQVAEAHGWTVTVTESGDGGARFEVAGVAIGVEETAV